MVRASKKKASGDHDRAGDALRRTNSGRPLVAWSHECSPVCIGMTPFAFRQESTRPGRSRQGFAIRDRRAAGALDGTCPAKKLCQVGEGSYCERISVGESLTTPGPFHGGRSLVPACDSHSCSITVLRSVA